MVSILDRDGPRPIIIPGNPWPFYVVTVISIFIVLLVFIYLAYLVATTPPQKSAIEECAPGQCATNIYTGVKVRCPGNASEAVSIDTGFEVCNSPFTCENVATPFAVQSDGSTNLDGICPTGVKCRCLEKPQCANHVTAIFNVENGNAFSGIASQPIVFNQVTDYIDREGVYFNQPPIIYDSVVTQFCTVTEEIVGINKISCDVPDCPKDKPECVPDAACNRTWSRVELNKPCLKGVLAYVPEDSANFDPNDTSDTLLSCVIGSPCTGANEIPYWNVKYNKVSCAVKTPNNS